MPQVGPLRIKVQLYDEVERAFGPGRARLLEAINQEGSISAAGRSLGMSYRYTWLLVDSMNRCFSSQLVEAAAGGRRGGGAVLTDQGRRVLGAYRALEADLVRVARGEPLKALEGMLRPNPDRGADDGPGLDREAGNP